MEKLLPLPHHPHVTIVQINDLQRQVILLAGGQFLNTHLDAGLAGNTSHHFPGMGKLHAHR